jgi:ABC-type Fe3+-hydroxamate transport system substrate-binding protein
MNFKKLKNLLSLFSNLGNSIKTKPNTKVAYWAALPKGDNPDVITAYGDYSNSGVVMSDANGNAVLQFNKGTGYIVPGGKYIRPHVHYRVFYSHHPEILSRVHTVYL